MDCGKMQSVVRKSKKKHVKDELDRIKQAEKKKRRLEKALATSAAIRAELEKKKQQKIEEQQRLDEVGAAIAEAVALHVLLDDDSDDIYNGMLKKNEGLNPWECGNSFGLITSGKQPMLPEQNISKCSLEGIGLVSDVYRYGCKWDDAGSSGWMVASEPLSRDPCWQYFEEGGGLESTTISAGLIAAQAVSALNISEGAPLEAYAFNQMMRG